MADAPSVKGPRKHDVGAMAFRSSALIKKAMHGKGSKLRRFSREEATLSRAASAWVKSIRSQIMDDDHEARVLAEVNGMLDQTSYTSLQSFLLDAATVFERLSDNDRAVIVETVRAV